MLILPHSVRAVFPCIGFFVFNKCTSVTLLPAAADFLSDHLTLEHTTVAPYRLSHLCHAKIIL